MGSWTTGTATYGTMATTAAAQAASQTMLFAPPGMSLHEPQSPMLLPDICCVDIVIALSAVMALA